MSFREKRAWVTIFALLVVFLPYYIYMVNVYHQPNPNIGYLMTLVATAIAVFIALECVLLVAARKLSPEDAGISLDERDQLLAYKASRTAYLTLICLVVVVTFPMIHIHAGNWGFGMLYLAAIIVAEITRASLLIRQYRRGY
jgi:archaellum biogenesis protein FlaJ (TadC family)